MIIWFFNFFNSIITHLVCHIGIDRSKLTKTIKVANVLNLKGSKLQIFETYGGKVHFSLFFCQVA